jgi:hypothetical protein
VRLFLVLCTIALAGCASPGGPGSHAGETYVVNSQRTLFYSYGPSQATGPDFALYHGQLVTMLSYDYGFSHVAIQGTGQAGYVPTEDLVRAPQSAQPSPTPAGGAHHRHIAAYSPPNAATAPDVPLPALPESELPANAPAFRY